MSCLEQLHVRELYDILPIEEWCQELLKNGDKSFYEDISKAVQDVFDTKPSLQLEDKIRSVFKFRKKLKAYIRLGTIHKMRRSIFCDFDTPMSAVLNANKYFDEYVYLPKDDWGIRNSSFST